MPAAICSKLTPSMNRHMDVHPGDVVAIQGVGGLGHLGIQFANKMGFKTVAISRGPEKKDFAEKLGAHVYIDSNAEDPAEALQKLGGAKVIAAVAPSGEAMEQLVGGLAVNGQLLTLAVADKLEVPIMTLIQKRASVRGWPSGSAADSEDTVKFAQTAGVECMVEEYPLDKVNEAFGAMMEGKARCVKLAFWSFHRWATQLTSPPAGSALSLSSSRERSPSSYGTFAKFPEVVLLVRVRQISREGAGRPCFAERLQQTILDRAVKVSFYTREGGDGERRICAPSLSRSREAGRPRGRGRLRRPGPSRRQTCIRAASRCPIGSAAV